MIEAMLEAAEKQNDSKHNNTLSQIAVISHSV